MPTRADALALAGLAADRGTLVIFGGPDPTAPPDAYLAEPSVDRVIRASYELLGRISFFTVGEDEVRAWTIRKGTRAREAGGAIHSDIQRGFIRAEAVGSHLLLARGSLASCCRISKWATSSAARPATSRSSS